MYTSFVMCNMMMRYVLTSVTVVACGEGELPSAASTLLHFYLEAPSFSTFLFTCLCLFLSVVLWKRVSTLYTLVQGIYMSLQKFSVF